MAANASPRFENCTFTNNQAAAEGSALYAAWSEGGPPTNVEIQGCRFIHNLTTGPPQYGGVDIAACQGATVTVDNSFFLGDTTLIAASVKASDSYVTLNNCTVSGYEFINFEVENDSIGGYLRINNCIVNHGTGLAFLVSLPEDSVIVSQSVIYGYGPILPESTITIDSYMIINPLFCDTAAGDYHISDTSPCAPDNNQWGVLIGAYEPACHIPYVCGDADGNLSVSITDAVFIVAYIFGQASEAPSPMEAADPNCSGSINMADCVYLIGYIFGYGLDPCDPDGDGEPDC
jgi:hypothetical protein